MLAFARRTRELPRRSIGRNREEASMILSPRRASRRDVLGAGLAASAIAFVPAAAWADATLDRLKKTGKVSVGIANEKPYGYVETDGRLAGAVPDIILAALTPHGV